jgi:hypothetical protein
VRTIFRSGNRLVSYLGAVRQGPETADLQRLGVKFADFTVDTCFWSDLSGRLPVECGPRRLRWGGAFIVDEVKPGFERLGDSTCVFNNTESSRIS